MNWIESILYGLISGITEFLPISSSAHQQILQKLFGLNTADPIQDLFVHLALVAAVISGCWEVIVQLRRGRQLRLHNRRGVRGNSDILELQLLKNAVLPMVICYFVLFNCFTFDNNMICIAIFSLLNALILFFSSRMLQGNKDERSVSILDSVTLGVSGALAVFPGISRIAAMLSASILRGIDRRKAVNWVLLLCIPALILSSLLDIINLLTPNAGVQVTGSLPGYFLSAIGAYITGYIGVILMRSTTANKDYSGYSYYAIGITLFALFLYLFIV